MTWDGDAEIYTWEAKDKKTYLVDAEGKTFQMEDGKGNSLTFSYNAGTGLLETVTDNFGRSLIFTYYADGKLETVTDPAGHTVTYHYTGENLTQVDYPDGRYKSYRYEDPYDSHNLTSILFGQEGAGATELEYEWTYDEPGPGRNVEQGGRERTGHTGLHLRDPDRNDQLPERDDHVHLRADPGAAQGHGRLRPGLPELRGHLGHHLRIR